MSGLLPILATAALGTHGRFLGATCLYVLRTLSQSLGQGILGDFLLQELLYLLEVVHVFLAHQGDGHAITVGAGGTAYAVHVVLGIVGHVIVDDHGDVVYVDAAGHDVGGHEHVYLVALELVHDVVTLGLLQVGVHLAAVHVLALQGSGQLLHLHLAAAEDDDALQVSGLEDVLDDAHLLGLVAHVGTLLYLLRGLAHGQFDDFRVLEQSLGQVLYLVGHGGGKHDSLAGGGYLLGYGHDVLGEAHVEHAVGLVEHEEAHLAKIHVAQADVGDKAAGGGYHHVGSHAQALQLLIVAIAVIAAVDGHTTHAWQVIAEALHGLVYLLRQFAGGRHNHAIDGILRISPVGQLAEDGQQVGRGLSGASLCHAQHVVSIKDFGYTSLLHGCASVEAHVVKRVEHVIV